MRILFAGTPEIAVPSLEALSKEFTICGVLTNPDRPQGRKKVLTPSAVKSKALELGLKVYQPEKLTTDFYEVVKDLNPDLLVCIAYGKIFRKAFLDIFPLGGLNIHPSLLPKYRGPSPISEAILHGDTTSGISIQRLALKMDSGNILLQKEFEIKPTDTTGSITDMVAERASVYITSVVKDLESNSVTEFEQNDADATFCKLIEKEDGIINWNLESKVLVNQIRAFNPWPYSQTIFQDKKLNILEGFVADEPVTSGKPGEVLEYSKANGFLVKTGNGAIYITKLQLQSKKALDYKSFNNGVKDFVGAVLG